MQKIYFNYVASFKGLSKEIWLLALVTFINRAGAMVIPFLSLYLVNSLGFTLPQVGWIMTCFGIGSLVGTWIGGKLTDTIGFYKVITASLFLGGIGFFILQYINTFYGFCFGIFSLILVADAYRPAIFVATETYSKPENTTRSLTLIHLAINLGFSLGPVIGGIIIATIHYKALFWIDGSTCMIASILLLLLLKPKKISLEEKQLAKVKEGISPYKNKTFLLFVFIMIATGLTFVQYFSVIPLYYERVHGLTEDIIGWILFLNGSLIVIFEMPLISWMERLQLSKTMALFWGTVFLMSSFAILNLSTWGGTLIIGMILLTIGEMISSPFSNAIALEMAPKGRKGSYMGVFSMSYSIAHIVGHNTGMNLVSALGFKSTWYITSFFLAFIIGLILWLHYILKRKKMDIR